MNTNRVKETLFNILNRFKSGDIPKAIAYSVFPVPNVPSAKWSLLNRTIMFLAGTMDGRGWRQWQEVNRYVKRGSKAFYILVPFMKRLEDENGDDKQTLLGFGCKPIFRSQDTYGEDLDYEQIDVPDLPLLQRAQEWGISVKSIPGNYGYYGYYSQARREIALATKEECVFFHEISHCAHEMVKGTLKKGQDPFQEITAELCAHALCRIVGKSGERYLGNAYTYISNYASKLKLSPLSACAKVMGEAEKVLNLILKGGEEYEEQRIAVSQ